MIRCQVAATWQQVFLQVMIREIYFFHKWLELADCFFNLLECSFATAWNDFLKNVLPGGSICCLNVDCVRLFETASLHLWFLHLYELGVSWVMRLFKTTSVLQVTSEVRFSCQIRSRWLLRPLLLLSFHMCNLHVSGKVADRFGVVSELMAVLNLKCFAFRWGFWSHRLDSPECTTLSVALPQVSVTELRQKSQRKLPHATLLQAVASAPTQPEGVAMRSAKQGIKRGKKHKGDTCLGVRHVVWQKSGSENEGSGREDVMLGFRKWRWCWGFWGKLKVPEGSKVLRLFWKVVPSGGWLVT